ncbi:MAG: HU family DNA-binding protein [Fermentimonas sp.]|nr:HU family DNA-binding protein [Fermentimonas sp.]
MTQKELIEKLAAKLQWDESDTSEVLEVISTILAEHLSDHNEVSIENFGVFRTHKYQEFILIDSDTGDHFLMPPEVDVTFEQYFDVASEAAETMPKISFETDDSLKSNINSAFQNFEPTLINVGVEFPGIEVITTGETEDLVEEAETGTVDGIKEADEIVEKTEIESDLEVRETEVIVESNEIEDLPEITQPAYSEEEPILKPGPEPEPIPDLQSERSLRPKTRSRKSSRVFVPVLGGVVIIMATLFFFNGVASRKRSKSRKSIDS